MVKWLWNNDGWCMWHTNVCTSSLSALWILSVSEANLACSLFLFFSVLRPLLLVHGPSQLMSLIFCILWQFCFPILPPAIFTPHSKIGRILTWVCCCFSMAMSELPIMACPNSITCTLQQQGAVAYGQSTVTLPHYAASVFPCEETLQRP